jgi:hypothetical protein
MWREYLFYRDVSIVADVLVLAQIVLMMTTTFQRTSGFSFHAKISTLRSRAGEIFKATSCVDNSSNSNVPLKIEPWLRNVPIDYSAANEFIQAHYDGDDSSNDNENCTYFPASATRLESVYNARLGVYNDTAKQWQPATMPSCGFTLLSDVSSTEESPQIADWTNRSEIEEFYLPRLRELLMQQDWGRNATVSHVIFWHPLQRGVDDADDQQQLPLSLRDVEGQQPPQTIPRSGYVSTAHIDTDLGA